MNSLSTKVRIARRFQKSINISADIGDQSALEGFICPQSSQQLLGQMAKHIQSTGQGAFTWTGPYGSGKSSLAVALAGVLCGTKRNREINAALLGSAFAGSLWKSLPPKKTGWKVIPVVGRRDDPVALIGKAIEDSQYVNDHSGQWSTASLISTVRELSAQNPRSSGGLILFIDEMGKLLEAAARDDHDIYLFQELAEAASRSKGRLIIIGVLHQSFQEYANRLSRELRDEWAKIQGRYVDLVVDTTGQEQLELIAKAIETDGKVLSGSGVVETVSNHVSKNTGMDNDSLSELLENCWPLHPVVACLLGPISRRRFGQNQRSIFGFLNSAEPHAFQQFLAKATLDNLYYPESLWDYLRTNLEPSILASPDGHRWSMAVEAIERCEGLSEDQFAVNLLKCISLIDLFKESSGLRASDSLLYASLHKSSKQKYRKAISFLNQNSLVIFRKFQNAYGIYAGRDFDIETEVERVRSDLSEIDLEILYTIADIHPLLAKRHYHETGALRWFDISFSSLNNVANDVTNYQATAGSVGQILVVLPTNGESLDEAARICHKAACSAAEENVIVGFPTNGHQVGQLAVDLIALDSVRNHSPELAGDSVARREVTFRLSNLQQLLEEAIQSAFESATWYLGKHERKRNLSRGELNKWISICCARWFSESPIIRNELLNRRQPSSNAIAAQNQLLRLMVTKRGDANLGIEGFPAEAGLLRSLLINTGLYTEKKNTWGFVKLEKSTDHAHLIPMFSDTLKYLKSNKSSAVRLGDIYMRWRERPFGAAEGLMPILAVAFLLLHSKSIAFYRDGLFRSEISDLDVDILTKDENSIQLRWMDLTGNSKKLLSGLAGIIQSVGSNRKLIHLQPIDVARGLVAIHDTLPGWAQRTQKLSTNTLKIRRLLNQARDPNKFLFGDLPSVLQKEAVEFEKLNIDQMVETIGDSILEMTGAYPSLLAKLRGLLLDELDIPNSSNSSLSELHERAKNIEGIGGEFITEAFTKRIGVFDASDSHIESIASMAASKPVSNWVDQDVQKAMLEIAAFCRDFRRAESFAHIHNRDDKRRAISVVVGIEGRQQEIWSEFDVSDHDRTSIARLSKNVRKVLNSVQDQNLNIVLASLAEISAEYLRKQNDSSSSSLEGKVA